jgi:hypothetical protein
MLERSEGFAHETKQHLEEITRNPPTSDHLTSQPSWTPMIAGKVRQLQLCPVQITCENCVFMLV